MLLALLPRHAKMAELGVFEGEFSEELLKIDPQELHLIDLWAGPMQCGDKDGNNIKTLSDLEMGRVYYGLRRKYAKHPRFGIAPIVKLHREDVASALSSFPDGYFDFVYVDADHHYEAVKAHLELAATKLKPTGFLGGHDYGAPYLGVVKAVDEFALHHNWDWIAKTTGDGCPSFLLRRP